MKAILLCEKENIENIKYDFQIKIYKLHHMKKKNLWTFVLLKEKAIEKKTSENQEEIKFQNNFA